MRQTSTIATPEHSLCALASVTLDAQTAVANAVSVLTQFYKESGMVAKEAWEFVQQKRGVELPENPATWDSSYTGAALSISQDDEMIWAESFQFFFAVN